MLIIFKTIKAKTESTFFIAPTNPIMRFFSIQTHIVFYTLGAISLLAMGCTKGTDTPSVASPPGVSTDFRITSDVTWTNVVEDPEKPDYLVKGNIVIEDDVMLTIMPGVVIQFESGCDGITVANGALQAVGNAFAPIVFKGFRENSGSWLGLQINTNDARNELNYCKVFHAGSSCGNAAIAVRGNLGIYPSQLKISNTEVAQSAGYGIVIDKVSRFGAFTANSFHDCARAGARITNPQLGSLDATSNFFGNTLNYVEILGEGLVNFNVTLPHLSVPYLVETGDIRIKNGSLAIAPATEIRFKPNTALVVDELGIGSLIAIGTSAQPIVFKGTQNMPASWNGIAIFNSSTANVLRYCRVEGGGQIRANAWELLITMVLMEAIFGIAGIVAAPIYYAYIKSELRARDLV